ncbi:MAG: hypothetical protein EOO45_04955 [Flavobacterium sp.]|nr:MAG: hypothetical protein EOO45_04955 [Flavobacterium sp.]
MKNIILCLPVLLLLLGCGAASSDTPPQNFSPQSEKGLIIGTITFDSDKPQYDIYRFFYNATSGDKKFKKRNAGKFIIKAREENVRGFNGDFNDKKTYLFVIEREPGSYAFDQYNYLTHIGPSGTVNSSKKFAIPFEIKKGEIGYVGELEFFGTAEPGSPRIIVSDKLSRDLFEFKKKFPEINWDSAANKTAKSGNTGDGMISFQ